jgi:hypothetical protein
VVRRSPYPASVCRVLLHFETLTYSTISYSKFSPSGLGALSSSKIATLVADLAEEPSQTCQAAAPRYFDVA